jgi:zinc transport system permease protein
MHEFWELFTFGFFRNALLTALFVSISGGIIGTYVVTRRIVFISGGITHASFGGIGLAFLLGFNPILGAILFAIFSALGIQFFSHKFKVREDSSIAIWWAFGMALGIIFVFLTPGYTPNLMSYLFGNILTVSKQELQIMGAVLVLLVVVFRIFFRKILYISFDEEFAGISGLRVSLYNYGMIMLVALVVVMNIRAVGIILVLAQLTVPQATANLFSKDYRQIMILSVIFGLAGTLSGLFISFYLNIPSGATIIFTLIILFGVFRLIKWLLWYKNRFRLFIL